jgi:outer membrane protein OmpA-like peptidoglycan-associated protein
MQRKVLLVAALAALLAGCGSAPKVQTPDGNSRMPVNSDAAIESYVTRGATTDSQVSKREADAVKLEAVKRQLVALRQYVLIMGTNIANAPKPVPLVVAPKPRVVGDGETMEVRDQSIVFRVSPREGATQFAPSRDLQAVLLKAARESKRIEVRGRTSSETDSKASLREARDEAQSARDFLVKNGIPASKIGMSFTASGGFVLDNSTAQGKAFNRRAEIETMDMDTVAYRPALPAVATATKGMGTNAFHGVPDVGLANGE